MIKNKKKTPTPRYFTIKIQYYPINKSVFFVSLLMFFYLFILGGKYLTKDWVTVYATTKATVFHSSLPDGENFSPLTSQINPDVLLHGSREQQDIALTFDADMTPGMEAQLQTGEVASYYNQAVIDILNQTQTKATLFLTGMWIEMYPQVAAELAENPLFEFGNHSYSHPSFDGYCYGLGEIPDEQDSFQLQKTQELLRQITGTDNFYFRFPGGCYSQKDLDIVAEKHLKVIHWDVAGDDGFNNDPQAIINNVLNNVQNGSIIVLHMHGGPNAPKTADALPTIIQTLKERGFHFVKISELLEGSCQFVRSLGVKFFLGSTQSCS